MMRSLFSGVSGLKSHQTRMDVIGNNIANINTIGFKSSRVTFSDMLSQTSSGASAPSTNLGGINPKQIGLGANVASVDMVFTDGSAQATGKNTDVTINGNGLFVLMNGDNYYYSRDGAFEFDTNGNYVLPGSGLYVQGWNATEGLLNTNAVPENIVVRSGQTMGGTQTTNVDYSGNVNSASPMVTGISYTAGGGTADPTSVLEFRTVSEIRVMDALYMTYDERVMTATITAKADGSTETIDLSTITDSTTNEAWAPTHNTRYANSGSGANVTINDTKYTIQRIDYTLDENVKTLTDDTYVTFTLSNGSTVTLTASATENGFTPGSTFQLGSSFSDIATGDAAILTGVSTDIVNANLEETITKIEVRDSLNQSHVYPNSISYNAGNTVKVQYTNGDLETITSGTYSVNETIFDSVNVDGVNVIAATLTLSDGSTQKVTSGFYQRNHSIPITTIATIYDSEGNSHAVPVLIDKDASSYDQNITSDALTMARVVDEEGNNINYTTLDVETDDEGNLTNYVVTMSDGTTETVDPDQVSWDNRWRVYMAPTEGKAGPTYKFSFSETDGSTISGYLNVVMDEASGNPADGAPTYVYYNEDGTYNASATQGSSLYTVYSNGNGASPTTSSFTFDNTTQYAGNTTVYATSDGNAYGILTSIEIDAAGIITGSYSNGILRTEAQIAVAQFVNSAGLTKVGTSLYQQSNNSGTANIKTVDALGLSLTPSSLEMSNVELASELADMIVTQRGFQSNSKIMTVADEMLETIINTKR